MGSDFIIPCHLSPGISALDMEIRWSKDTASVCLYKNRRLTEGVFFKGRVSLFMTHKLRKGNVSLLLKNFMMSDIGDYHCQVISNDRSEEITVRGEQSSMCLFITSCQNLNLNRNLEIYVQYVISKLLD